MTEGDNNVRIVPRGFFSPDPDYATRPVGSFLGRCVKVAFQAADGTVEHMWVSIPGTEDDQLVGTLESHPVRVDHLKYGDRVIVDRLQVEVIYLEYDEWLAECRTLIAQGDYHNKYLGSPNSSSFAIAYAEGLSPRMALTCWRDYTSDIDKEKSND